MRIYKKNLPYAVEDRGGFFMENTFIASPNHRFFLTGKALGT